MVSQSVAVRVNPQPVNPQSVAVRVNPQPVLTHSQCGSASQLLCGLTHSQCGSASPMCGVADSVGQPDRCVGQWVVWVCSPMCGTVGSVVLQSDVWDSE